jgi:release factor glutamine methyltransferase
VAVGKNHGQPLLLLDLGAGTGCILITLLAELPEAVGVAVDISPGALRVARENAERHGVEARADFRLGSWFEPINPSESFDLIVSNPPYIPESDIESLALEVRNYDPFIALSGGDDGLLAYKMILNEMKKHLVCGGHALLEIGQGQEKALVRLVEDSMMTHTESYPDLSGIIRVVEMTCGEK